MPTYDYECRHCEHVFEAFQSITARPLKKCPACGKLKLGRRIGGGAGVIFRGSGFYATDYGRRAEDSGKKGAAAKAESPAGAGTKGKGAGASTGETASGD